MMIFTTRTQYVLTIALVLIRYRRTILWTTLALYLATALLK